MKDIVNNFQNIRSSINNSNVNIIAVSKTFSFDEIRPLIDLGHNHFGENKVQEAKDKWSNIRRGNSKLQLHMIGKLQTNKAKDAVELFDYIHSVDNEKLAKKIAEEQIKNNVNVKIFIQVNIGDEIQKSGISKDKLNDFYKYCLTLNLDVQGLMCIPPEGQNSDLFFKDLKKMNQDLGLKELSMGMSSDYMSAIENSATFVRIGSSIFGKRT